MEAEEMRGERGTQRKKWRDEKTGKKERERRDGKRKRRGYQSSSERLRRVE
jgi:hypothetical protein